MRDRDVVRFGGPVKGPHLEQAINLYIGARRKYLAETERIKEGACIPEVGRESNLQLKWSRANSARTLLWKM